MGFEGSGRVVTVDGGRWTEVKPRWLEMEMANTVWRGSSKGGRGSWSWQGDVILFRAQETTGWAPCIGGHCWALVEAHVRHCLLQMVMVSGKTRPDLKR